MLLFHVIVGCWFDLYVNYLQSQIIMTIVTMVIHIAVQIQMVIRIGLTVMISGIRIIVIIISM